MRKLLILFTLLSSIGYSQESIDEMFDDGQIDNYKVNPSVDVARLIAGTPNVNLELFLFKSVSITGGVGITFGAKLYSFEELMDGAGLYEKDIKTGLFLHSTAKFYYGERDGYRGYFGLNYNHHNVKLNVSGTQYNTGYYLQRSFHFGGGVQWHGAHNITYDYFLGVGFGQKDYYYNNIALPTDFFGASGFLFNFKVGYPIL